MAKKIEAKPISSGVGIGRILVIEDKQDPERAFGVVEEQTQEFLKAQEQVAAHIQKEVNRQSVDQPDQAEILEAHLLMLQDPEWAQEVVDKIKKEKYMASYAVFEATNEMVSLFRSMESDYFKERASDILDIGGQVIDVLENRETVDLVEISEPTILFASELLPSQTVLLNKEVIVGIVTEKGGKTSHTAIIAKTMGIPMISGAKDILKHEYNKKEAILAADEKMVLIDPSREEVTHYTKLIEKIKERNEYLKKYIGKKSVSEDGYEIEIAANISLPEDTVLAMENDAEGVGLFRSEFLFMDRESAPSEQEQYQAYSDALTNMKDRSVIIRTMDIGGDKEVSYLGILKEENPFLGLRAIRHSLREPSLFKVQIRALLRAGLKGNLKIMLPMISSLEEVRAAKQIIEEVKKNLRKENIAFNEGIPVGIMIEIPSAAIMSDQLGKEVDFFSIGTNDLIQYTVAVDRMNHTISDLYSYYNPAVLRLVAMTAQSAAKTGTWLGMCGDMAGDPLLLPFFVALGFDELSVTPSRVLGLRDDLTKIKRQNNELVKAVLDAKTVEEVMEILKK